MRRRLATWRAGLAIAAALGPAAARAAEPAADLAIAVAPFERIGPPGAGFPDAAQLLADRLATRGVGKVVGPAQLGAAPLSEPSVEQVRSWGAQAQTAMLVTGRSTRIGRAISLDLRLRSATTGDVLSTHVAEAAQEEDLNVAVDRLAEQIVRGALASPETPAVAARGAAPAAATDAPREASAPKGERSKGKASPGFFGVGRSDAPIAIHSNELEAFQDGGARRFVFTGKVQVTQGDLTLTSRRLEAFYPEGASQPERLDAAGRVVLSQQGKQAHCDRATYLRVQQRVLCFGDDADAELVQGEDRVRGKEIEFHLDSERLIVRGGADVRLQSGDTPGSSAAGADG